MFSSMEEDEFCLGTEMPEHEKLMKRLRKTLYFGGLKMPKTKIISRPLCDLASEVFTATHKDYSLNRLNYDIVGNVKATPCSLILALIYLDLIKELDPNYVRRISPSELFLVAMMVSTKFYSGYDEEVYLNEWAEYGHITVERMKSLEIEFLDAMDWKIFVSNEMFFKKLDEIEVILAQKQASRRGWLTYTELVTLMPCIDTIRQIISYSTMLAISYTAGVVAIASAFLIASNVPGSYLCRSQASNESSLDQSTTDCSSSSSPLVPCSTINHSDQAPNLDSESDENLTDLRIASMQFNLDSEELNAKQWTSGALKPPLVIKSDPGNSISDIENATFDAVRKRNSTSFVSDLYLSSNDHLLSYLWFKYL